MATILQVDDFLSDYFNVPGIKLPDLGDPTGGTEGNRKRVQGWINNYEPEALCFLLGDSLAFELQKYFDLPTEEKINDILNDLIGGAEFEGTDGFTYKWKGLKDLLISYVYYYIIRTPQFKELSFGTVRENSGTFDQGWNTSDRLGGDIWRLFIDKKYGIRFRTSNGTAFAYLFANQSDFPNWKFEELGIQSIF